MALPEIIPLLLIAVLIFLAFKFFKSIFHAIIAGIILLAFVFAIFSYALYKDINEISSTLDESRKTFVLVNGTGVITGFWATDIFTPVNYTIDLNNLSANITNRFFIFERKIFENSSKVIPLDSRNFTRGEFLSIIESNSSQESLALALNVDRANVEAQYSESVLKAKLFGYLAQDVLEDSKELSREFKKGNVVLEPKGPSFLALKYLPNFITERVFNVAFDIKEV